MASQSKSATYNACSDLLDRNVTEGRGDKLAFIDPEASLTYADLQTQTNRFANLMMRLGLRREDRVALVMLDTIDLPIAFLGAMRAGVVPIPLNTMLSNEQYGYMLDDSRARVLIVSQALWPILQTTLAQLPDLQHVLVVGGDAPPGTLQFHAELSRESAEFQTARTKADEPAFWLYSSGSTGAPKGTRHVHSSAMQTAELYAKPVLGIREDDVVFSAAKLFFAYGLGNSLSFPMAVGGYHNPQSRAPNTGNRVCVF